MKQPVNSKDRAAGAKVSEAGELLTFVVDGQHYGVDILRVQEIRGWESVTRMPNTPEHVRGVLNLRGAIVPIIDLRIRLGMPTIDYEPTTVIVVLQVMGGSSVRTMGIVVDAVSDVCAVSQGDVQDTPDFGAEVDTTFMRGIVSQGDELLVILDVDQLLGSDASAIASAAVAEVV